MAQSSYSLPGVKLPAKRSELTADEECARRLQEEFDREVADKVERTRFQCKLCLEMGTYDHSVELDCCHRFCSECFNSLLEVKIKEKNVKEEELCCPMPGCACAVTVLQIEGSTKGTPLWDRFLASRQELWRPDADRLCCCPSSDCAYQFLAAPDMAEVRCPQCRKAFCAQCGCTHQGVSCKSHAEQRRPDDQADRDLEELIKQQCWQRCPCCRAACEREDGCNFITCHSEICRGKNYFCYLCGKELTALQHFTHFPHGLFENACSDVDRREDANLAKPVWNEGVVVNWVAGAIGNLWQK